MTNRGLSQNIHLAECFFTLTLVFLYNKSPELKRGVNTRFKFERLLLTHNACCVCFSAFQSQNCSFMKYNFKQCNTDNIYNVTNIMLLSRKLLHNCVDQLCQYPCLEPPVTLLFLKSCLTLADRCLLLAHWTQSCSCPPAFKILIMWHVLLAVVKIHMQMSVYAQKIQKIIFLCLEFFSILMALTFKFTRTLKHTIQAPN